MAINFWLIVEIAAAVLLLAYARRRNALWGGLTLGIIVGLVYAAITGFDWDKVLHAATIGTFVGFLVELPATIGRFRGAR